MTATKKKIPEMQKEIANLINEAHDMILEYGKDEKSFNGDTVAEAYAEKILARLRERCKSANMPEPRYAPFGDKEIGDNYAAGFQTGRWSERSGFLRVLGEDWGRQANE